MRKAVLLQSQDRTVAGQDCSTSVQPPAMVLQSSSARLPAVDHELPRVLVLGLNYSPESTGIAPYTSALAKGLKERGFKVDVLTSHPHYPEWEIHPGYGAWNRHETIDAVSVRRLLHYVPGRPSGLKRLASELSFGLRLLGARWGDPDIVVMVSPALFANAMAALRIRLSARKPLINVWLQDLYSLGITETGMGGRAVARIVTWVEKKTLRAAAGVVVIHSRFAAYVTGELGVKAERVEVVRNWTHLEGAPDTDVAAVRRFREWGTEETVVLHAGNMGIKQGLENVVNAARLADQQNLPLRFVLLGNGSQREFLQELAENVHCLEFVDSLDNAGFQDALSAADILLVNEKPGVSEMAVPSKLTSYFNSGRPVLAAAAVTGVTASEIRAAGAGAVVVAGDPQALVDAAMGLSRNPVEAARFGANGLAYRRDTLGEEAAIDRYAKWLRGLAAADDRVQGRAVPARQ